MGNIASEPYFSTFLVIYRPTTINKRHEPSPKDIQSHIFPQTTYSQMGTYIYNSPEKRSQ